MSKVLDREVNHKGDQQGEINFISVGNEMIYISISIFLRREKHLSLSPLVNQVPGLNQD